MIKSIPSIYKIQYELIYNPKKIDMQHIEIELFYVLKPGKEKTTVIYLNPQYSFMFGTLINFDNFHIQHNMKVL